MKELRVEDSKRTNDLSLEPGGSIIRVEYGDGKNLIYDKIKNHVSYINKVTLDPDVCRVYLNDILYWEK